MKTLYPVLALIGLALLVFHLEYRNAPAEENMRSAYLRPCDASVSDGVHRDNMSSPRCYFFKDRR